jgi:hypothetical protein
MAWWDDLGEAFASGVETVAEVAETAATAVGDTVADVVETIGNAAQDGANSLGDVVASVPRIGGVLKGACAWVGGIIADNANFGGAIIKASFGIVAGLLGGLTRIVGGLLCLNGSLILKGLIDIGSSIAGAVLIVLGKLAALVQRIIFCQNNERPLTKAEKEMLHRVFHRSISLYNIRIIEGWSGIFGITTNGAFTLGNTIYSNATDFSVSPEILVHECVHVWQYQVLGARYTMDALGAQAIYGRNGSADDAYSWLAELDRGNTRWQDFNKEAAAEHIQDIWLVGSMVPLHPGIKPGHGTFYLAGDDVYLTSKGEFCFNGKDFSELAIASVKTLREGFNIRITKYLAVS